MKIGLVDVDSHKFPNLPLMKISAYHKSKGDEVEFLNPFTHYDKVYVSKIFGDEYSIYEPVCYDADEIIYGGTGFAITIENGKEVYDKNRDKELPYEIEHIYPDYSLYPGLTKDKAFGYLTRGCCNDCSFCIVSQKEGRCSVKVADLSEWWNGQKEIVLLDPNILACKEREELLLQLAKSNAKVDFTQGLDARFITPKICSILKKIKVKMYHFAFDFMKNEKQITKGLSTFVEQMKYSDSKSRNCYVYILTNYDTTIKQDIYRINKVREIGLSPDVRIYRKSTAPRALKDIQRWCNNRIIYRSCELCDYVPRSDGKTMVELYPEHFKKEGD